VSNNLEEKIISIFGKSLEVDIILYLGLCNGAGWVTTVNNQTRILLGIEKIIELNWRKPNDMIGLIYHELGHVYQDTYGTFKQKFKETLIKYSANITQSDFSADCTKIPPAYSRMSRDFCAI